MNFNLFRLPAQKAFQIRGIQLYRLQAFQASIFLDFQLKVTSGILLFRQLFNGIKTGWDISMQYFNSLLLVHSFHSLFFF